MYNWCLCCILPFGTKVHRDIDIYIAHTKDNPKRLKAAIKEFASANVDENYFNTDEPVILRIGIEPNQIEISNVLTGLKDREII